MQLHNRWGKPLRVLYLDMVPWFVRIYLHTLRIEAVREEGNPLASSNDSKAHPFICTFTMVILLE